jgi:2-desacetyl-2-hydroxyethyl bacteriochlorophyllide A dehydrogenase
LIARALFFEGPRRVAVRDIPLQQPRAGEVLVRGLASAVSQGTELLLYRDEGPSRFDPSLSPEPGPTYPRRYGYAWVGTVVRGGQLNPGTRVFALASHGSAHVLDETELRPIRSDVPPSRASLAANLETALTATWDAEAAYGERAVVLGAGVVGVLTAWLLARSGLEVTVVEPATRRRECALVLLGPVQVAASLADVNPIGRADLVVEATGRPEVLDEAITLCAPSARIIVLSFYGRRRAAVDLGDTFHRRRLTIASSQVSTIPPRLAGRWDIARRFGVVEDLLGEPRLDALVAPAVPFERASELYATLDADRDALPAHVFEYD